MYLTPVMPLNPAAWAGASAVFVAGVVDHVPRNQVIERNRRVLLQTLGAVLRVFADLGEP